MPIIPPARLDGHIVTNWYRTDEKMHQPIIKWLESSGAKPHIEKFCNELLEKAAREETVRQVQKRTMCVRICISTQKASQAFWNYVPEHLREGLDVEHVQFAVEMLLEEAGYSVSNGQMVHEVFIPPLQERVQERAPQPSPRPQLEAAEPAEEEPADAEPDVVLEAVPIQVGAVYSNGRGVLRCVHALEDGKVKYKEEGSEQVESCDYKSFVTWATVTVSVAAPPA